MCTIRVQHTKTIKGIRCSGFNCKAKVEIIIFCDRPKVWILNLMHPMMSTISYLGFAEH